MCERKNWEYLNLKDDVLKKYRHKCANCGSKEDLEIHHIVPLSLGGTNNITNLVPLCYSCHKAAHNGRHMSHFKKTYNNPQPRTPDEEAYKIFDDYFAGNIGTSKVRELMGFSKSYKIGDCPQFKRYVKEKGFERYRNNVDLIMKKCKRISPGEEVGYIVYANGVQETMIYQKDKLPKDEPPVKKKPDSVESLYEAYLVGAMGFAEADYRISRLRQYTQDDFRDTLDFQHYLRNHEIADYQNNVDMITNIRGSVKVGDEVGYILYTYGLRVPLIH